MTHVGRRGGTAVSDDDGGHVTEDPGECDDAVHPTAIEGCNGQDDDRVNGVDDGAQFTFYADTDHDHTRLSSPRRPASYRLSSIC